MRLRTAAIVATTLVIVAGVALISPLFARQHDQSEQRVMLSFSVLPSAEVDEWCKEVSAILDAEGIGASVFFVGKAAEQHPESVSYFNNKVDIGSQTYSNLDITSLSDYSMKLQEIKDGKMAVDEAGELTSRIFRAPFGATDQDIYSLLSRSGIQADFSYQYQYNVYENSQFIKYEAAVYEGRTYQPDTAITGGPLIVQLDNTYPISEIQAILSRLKTDDLKFVNASELAGFPLTVREGG